MALRYRQMRPEDVRKGVEIVSAHPFLSARYGRAILDLDKAWRRLLGREAFTAVVFEESLHGGSRIVGVGVSVFLSDQFVREIKTPPLRWVGPKLAGRIVGGESPVLSDREVRQANTAGGLNLFGWHGAFRPEDGKRVEVLNFMFSAFLELHRGFLIKELIGEADDPALAQALSNTGGLFFDPTLSRYVNLPSGSAEDIVNRPHLIGCTRELALGKPGFWGSSLFSYESPRFGLRRSEQKLLAAALHGGTDEDLSKTLGVSLSAVRKSWLSIYERVADRVPGLLNEDAPPGNGTSKRGKGKKHRLLAYLSEHPEELRPVSRKVLPSSTRAGSETMPR